MAFPALGTEDVLRLAALPTGCWAVDDLSVHRDIALATLVRVGSEEEILVSARWDERRWRQADTIGDRESVDVQFGGGAPWMAGRALTFRIPGIVTRRTIVSPRGNWSFVYSDPEGRRVAGTSVVDGDFGHP